MLTKSYAITIGFHQKLNILIGIGTNLPDTVGRAPLEIANAAALSLKSLTSVKQLRLSRWYGSAPIPASDQPAYINGVAWLDADIDAFRLLEEACT